MKRIQFVLNIPRNFDFDIIEIDPATDLGIGWKFVENEINGIANNDGITAFQKTIEQAATLPKDEGRKLLFPTGLVEGQTTITGEDKIKALMNLPLADPDLLWSLYKEKGQKTLRYLHDTYGITWMEALRRILLLPDDDRYSLCLLRGHGGSWGYGYDWLGRDRNAVSPGLSLVI